MRRALGDQIGFSSFYEVLAGGEVVVRFPSFVQEAVEIDRRRVAARHEDGVRSHACVAEAGRRNHVLQAHGGHTTIVSTGEVGRYSPTRHVLTGSLAFRVFGEPTVRETRQAE